MTKYWNVHAQTNTVFMIILQRYEGNKWTHTSACITQTQLCTQIQIYQRERQRERELCYTLYIERKKEPTLHMCVLCGGKIVLEP